MSNCQQRIRIAAAQFNHTGSIESNVDSIQRLANQARTSKADVLLLPECALTGYTQDPATFPNRSLVQALGAIGRTARACSLHILLGTPLRRNRRCYNTVVAFDRTGQPAHVYAKCQLTARDRQSYHPGNALSLFTLDGIPATVLICHERRYPELVRLPVQLGARIVFHANAGLDPLRVSRRKRDGRDGIPARAFENAVFYVFANTVGPQAPGLWSAGDTKILAPNLDRLAWAGNDSTGLIVSSLDLTLASRAYALEMLSQPRFLRVPLRRLLSVVRLQARRESHAWTALLRRALRRENQ